MKKLINIIATVFMFTSLALVFTSCGKDNQAEENDAEWFTYYPLSNGTFAIAQGYTTYLEELVIPSKYKGKAVTMIVEKGFENSKAKAITIPDSVTAIGDNAFSNCSSLENVTLGNNVTAIGDNAFNRCFNLTSITIPNSVTSIGDKAFYSCSRLNTIIIPVSVTYIGFEAFNNEISFRNKYYYNGTAQDWSKISIKTSYISDNQIYYYSESSPTVEGKYWHYVDGVPTAW